MSAINNIGTLKEFEKLIDNYLGDGYNIASLFKDDVCIIVKLTHKNGKIVMGKYDYFSSTYSIR